MDAAGSLSYRLRCHSTYRGSTSLNIDQIPIAGGGDYLSMYDFAHSYTIQTTFDMG